LLVEYTELGVLESDTAETIGGRFEMQAVFAVADVRPAIPGKFEIVGVFSAYRSFIVKLGLFTPK